MRFAIAQHLRSFLTGKSPLPSQIEEGEIAINFPDQKLYSKDEDGIIVQVGAGRLDSLTNVSNAIPDNKQILQFNNSIWEGKTLSPSIQVALTGPITGSNTRILVNLESNVITIPTTVTPNSIVLTRDTTGYYVGNLVSNSGIYTSYIPGEDSFPRIWIGQNVDTTSNVLFNNVEATANVNASNTRTSGNSSVIGRITTGSVVGIGAGFQNEVWITTSQTWNIPDGVDTFYIMAMGGAGSGGSAQSGLLAPTRYGCGGNSGAVCWKTYKRVNGVNSVSITVGAGGVVTTVGQKTNGGNTSVTYNSQTMTANGGAAGNHWDETHNTTSALFSGADFGIVGTIGEYGGTGGNLGSGNGSPLGFGLRTPMPYQGSAMTGMNGIGYNSPGAGGTTGTANSSRRGGNGTGGFVLIKY